jgi:predicted DNA-binding transcriptional regulator AlpA
MDTNNLPAGLRIKQIVKPDGVLPISAAHWWQGVKDGRYPKPALQSGRLTVWKTSDVLAVLEGKSCA